jgi:capsular polysaccharide transport system permease protein
MATTNPEDWSLRPAQRPRLRTVRPRFVSLRTVTALVLREMSTTYGRSPGGYLWAVLEPAAGIALLTFVFALFLRNPPLGDSFALFYATGIIPFLTFSDISNKIAQALNFSRSLLAYPRITFLDAIVARLLLNGMTQVMVAAVIFGVMLNLIETRTILHLDDAALALVLAAMLALGVGTLNCYLVTRFPVWQQVWGIAMRPLGLISGIIHVYDMLPRELQAVLWYNPLVHVLGLMRRAFYVGYDAPYVSVPYVVGVALVCFALGLALLRKTYHDLLQR